MMFHIMTIVGLLARLGGWVITVLAVINDDFAKAIFFLLLVISMDISDLRTEQLEDNK